MVRGLLGLDLLRRLFCRHVWVCANIWDYDLESVVVRCRKCGKEVWS